MANSKKLDLSKTQFLEVDHGTHKSLWAFRRHSRMMLMGRDGRPIRQITWEGWLELKEKWPDEVKDTGLHVKVAWFLEEVPLG